VTKPRPAVECATRFIAVSELHDNLMRANFTDPLLSRSAFQRRCPSAGKLGPTNAIQREI
jgi:hypothetical protein